MKTSLNRDSKISRGVLEDLYNNIENAPNKPTWCWFQGIKYKTGSAPLKKALNKWYKNHEKELKETL